MPTYRNQKNQKIIFTCGDMMYQVGAYGKVTIAKPNMADLQWHLDRKSLVEIPEEAPPAAASKPADDGGGGKEKSSGKK